MQDLFEQAEVIGRTIVEKFISGHCINYEFTIDKFNHIDLFVTGYTKTASIEIKNRQTYTLNEINNLGGLFLPYHKYCALTGTTVSGYTPYYLAIFKDEIVIWDISNYKPEWVEKELPKATMEDRGTQTYKISYLKIEDAVWKKKFGNQ